MEKVRSRDIRATLMGASLIGVAALALSSCVSITSPAIEERLVSRQVSEKNYTIGQTLEAYVGGAIVRVKDYRVTDVARNEVEVKTDFAFDHFLFRRHFRAGEHYPYGGEATYDGRTYHVMKVDQFGIMFDDDGQVLNRIIGGIGQRGMVPVVMIYEFDPIPADAHVARVVVPQVDRAGFGKNFELIFTGLTADSIRVAYREYSPDNLARPAFYQDLTYPIGAGKIRFRDLDIEVLSAKADRIVYRVLADAPIANSR